MDSLQYCSPNCRQGGRGPKTSNNLPDVICACPPPQDVEALGKKLGFMQSQKNFHNVSLGQGQEVVAEEAMEVAARDAVFRQIH